MNSFFQNHMGLIFDVYGLAFFVLGTSVFVLPKRDTTLSMAPHLGWLAAFGMLHGLLEFTNNARLPSTSSWLVMPISILLISSFGALLEFGRRAWNQTGVFVRLPPAWIYGLVLAGLVIFILRTSDPMAGLSAGVYYLVGAPGALLSAFALALMRKQSTQTDVSLASWLGLAAVAMAAYAVLALFIGTDDPGLVLLPSKANFLALTGVPVELFRSMCAVLAAAAFVMIIRRTGDRNVQALILEAAGIVSWDYDLATGGFVRPEAMYRMLGVPSNTLKPNVATLNELIHPDDQPVMQAWLEACTAGQQPKALQLRWVRHDGTIRHFECHGKLLLNRRGAPFRISGTVQDITEHKRSEALAHQVGNLLQNSFDEIYIFNGGNLHFDQASEGAQKNLGYSFQELKQLTPLDVKPLFTRETFEQMIAPLRSGKEKLLSFETLHKRKDGSTYPVEVRLQLLQKEGFQYLAIIQDITQRKAAEEEIQRLAFLDPLTHLPNRRLLMDRMKESLASSARSGRHGALMFIDLDNFKTLNDTLGHDIGDLLLQKIAKSLLFCVRNGDTVARLGGDEFVVVLEVLSEDSLHAMAQTKALGEKILAALNVTFDLYKQGYHNSASIGATLFKGQQTPIEDLMKRADIAMYQAKKGGRGSMLFFHDQMQDAVNVNAALENDLRKALENQEFRLYYQIQVDSSCRPIGVEALIRWLHPERGLISPDQFIPAAEESGLILRIGQWVLETACAQIKDWQNDDLASNLDLAVNVSAKQFRQTDFVDQVKAAIQRHVIEPKLLKLELTEGLLLENVQEAIATMNELKKVGIQFSIDDFGAGYSSLQYLKRLPLNQLKIDRSFVRDIVTDGSDKAIVRTIIGIAQSLDLDVIAEGVETQEQRKILLESGCAKYQGYLFSKPLPIEQLDALLRRSRSALVDRGLSIFLES
jgi:diguanylate cyclase (GGDEF)-like protein/PAS domain S-box-containing protein